MALVTRTLLSFVDGGAGLRYTFDDASLLITTVVGTNNLPLPFAVELHRTGDNVVLWSGEVLPLGQTPNPPATLAPGSYDVAPANLHMSLQTNPMGGGMMLMPPYGIYGRYPA